LGPNIREEYPKIGHEKCESIGAINVLEYIRDDILALRELYKLLKRDGMLNFLNHVISFCVT
jgi:hypothetical protein